MYKFKIIKNKKGEFRAQFAFRAEPIFWTENYTTRKSAVNAIEKFTKNAAAAKIEDIDESAKAPAKKAAKPAAKKAAPKKAAKVAEVKK